MRRIVLATILAVGVALVPALSAHHSHGAEFFLEQDSTIEGTLERLEFKNPHTVLTLRTGDSTIYTAEWQGAIWLKTHPQMVLPVRAPVEPGTLRIGDRLRITGAPAKDPMRHELVVLKDVRRPSDGWRWTCDNLERHMMCGRGA